MTTRVATGLLVVMTTIAGVFELTSIPFVRQPFASLTVGVAFLATGVLTVFFVRRSKRRT